MKVWCLLLFLLQASRLPNGTTIPACPGQDVTMSWSYTTGVAEHLTNVEWHYTPPGGSDTLIATQVMGSFFAAPGSSQHVQFLPNAGIRLQNVAIADTGTYTVRVNMDVHGSTVREMQSAEVLVSDQPITTDDQLHVTMLPDAVYVNSTRQYHVQLACGDFLPVWGHRASVVWKTPDNQTLPSTSGENGRFLLSVPIPVVTGEYSCILDDTSPASLCVQSGSPLQRGATVNVDGVQAQIVTLEARMNSYQQENSVLKQQLESQKQEVVAQKQQLETQKQQLETQEQEVENQKHRLENQTQQQEIHRQEVHVLKQQLETMRHNLTSMIETAARSVSFHAFQSSSRALNVGDTIVFDQIISNEGGAYNSGTGVFTVPVDGTYAFFVTVTTYPSSQDSNPTVYLYADSTTLTKAYSSYESGHYESNSCHAIVFLRTGQRVYVQNGKSNSVYLPYYYTHFSGALLHAAMP